MFDIVTPAPRHPNTMRFVARDGEGRVMADETWLSVGGGFIIRDGGDADRSAPEPQLPYPFRSGAELLARGREAKLSIAELMRANEAALRSEGEADEHAERILDVMFASVDRGLTRTGPLPGGLQGHAPRQGDPRSSDRSVASAIFTRRTRSWISSASTRWRSTRRMRPAGAS